VILFILLVGHPPFYGKNDEETFQLVKKGEFTFPTEKWVKISEDAKDLVSKMLVVNPEQRISAEDAYSHKFL
jgi:calcium-dependent protein kinase